MSVLLLLFRIFQISIIYIMAQYSKLKLFISEIICKTKSPENKILITISIYCKHVIEIKSIYVDENIALSLMIKDDLKLIDVKNIIRQNKKEYLIKSCDLLTAAQIY